MKTLVRNGKVSRDEKEARLKEVSGKDIAVIGDW